MKRFIVIQVSADMDNVAIQTDDIKATVQDLADQGYDLNFGFEDEDDEDGNPVVSQESINDIVNTLIKQNYWPAEDGSDGLILIDTQNIAHDTTVG